MKSIERWLRKLQIYLNVIDRNDDPNSDFVKMWKEKLEAEGFEVRVRDRRTCLSVMDLADPSRITEEKQMLMNELYRSVSDMKKDYDLYLYVCNMENASNNTTLRLNWNVLFGLGDDAPWHAAEIPMLMVSTAYPYHLFDAPMMKTYINAYSSNDDFVTACIEKMMGRSEFKGISPIDPLCGKDYI